MANTIYALSTPFFKSAIAIVRVSGENALESLEILSNLKKVVPFKFKLVTLKNSKGTAIDQPLVVYFPKNNSYTGEDLVEYHIHGSIAVIKELLTTLGSIPGLRLAYPGEFTKRALENNKMTLIEAEGLIDLIDAETTLQKQQALQIIKGEVEQKYQNWLELIKENLSLLTAAIDFSDENLPENILINIDRDINRLINDVNTELNKYNGIKKLKQGINVAIIGAPNVGKSTLINYLAQDDVSITSNIPGTTRDAITTTLDIADFPVILIDTAGIRKTKNAIEKLGINKSFTKAKTADLKIIILDATNLVFTLQQIEAFINDSYLIIVNKVDLIDADLKKEIDTILDNKNLKYIFVSLELKQNLEKLQECLIEQLKIISRINEHPIIINERHKNTIEALLISLKEFSNNKDIVIKAHFLQEAINTLGKVLGLNNIEDVLDKVFSKFCIGK